MDVRLRIDPEMIRQFEKAGEKIKAELKLMAESIQKTGVPAISANKAIRDMKPNWPFGIDFKPKKIRHTQYMVSPSISTWVGRHRIEALWPDDDEQAADGGEDEGDG